jgi:hypothetical protein
MTKYLEKEVGLFDWKKGFDVVRKWARFYNFKLTSLAIKQKKYLHNGTHTAKAENGAQYLLNWLKFVQGSVI